MTTGTIPEATTWAAAFEQLDGSAPVHALRRAAFERFRALGFPTTRHEEWRYTNVRPIAETAFARPADDAPAATAEAIRAHLFRETDCHQLVFVNGRFRDDLSTILPTSGATRLGSLAAALATDHAAVEPWLGRHAAFEDEAFTALNTAFIEDGAVVHVPRGADPERPVHLLFAVVPEAGRAIATHPRILIVLGENARATVVESYVALGSGASLTNAVTEIVAADGARLDHYKFEHESAEAFHVSSLCTQQGRDANVTSHNFSIGGRLVRNNVEAALAGQGGDATFNGLYLTRGEQHVDNHLRVLHLEPHCTSWEYYKGVLDDRSRGVFSGRIFVARDAQKTDAKQTNMNLLLSDDASATAKPQLEIFADDVRCTHGATTGQLEDSHLFYLQARGIDRESARALLIYAFANETIAEVQVDELRRRLVRLLRERIPEGDILHEESDAHHASRGHRDL